MTLDADLDRFRAMLDDARDVVLRLYDSLEDRPVFPGLDAAEVAALFDEPLPRSGRPLEDVLRRVEEDVFRASTLNIHPRFLSNVMSGGSQVGVVASLLLAALNQNGGKWRVAPAHTELEQRTVGWVGDLIGFPAGGGLFVSGGSSANHHGLAAARAARAGFDVRRDGLRAGPQLTVYASATAHSALDKAVDLLGIGRRYLRKVPPRPDGTADVAALRAAIREDRAAGRRPVCVVGSAGTVNTGAVDPLDDLADLAADEDVWLHLDGAYGAPAAATAAAGHLFTGLGRADSIALDPHKWLSVPFAAGCILVRDYAHLRAAFSVVPDYLRDGVDEGPGDAMEHGFALSRPFRALKVWMTFQVYGADRLRDEIDANIRVMRHLGDLVDAAPDLERLHEVTLSVCCFRYRPPGMDDEAVDALNRRLVRALDDDGRVFISGSRVAGHECLRACTVNHRTTRDHVETAVAVVRELGARLAGNG